MHHQLETETCTILVLYTLSRQQTEHGLDQCFWVRHLLYSEYKSIRIWHFETNVCTGLWRHNQVKCRGNSSRRSTAAISYHQRNRINACNCNRILTTQQLSGRVECWLYQIWCWVFIQDHMLTQATSRDERHKNPVFRRVDKPWCRTNKIQHLQSLICAYSNETDVFLSIELATCCHAKRKCCSYLWKKGFTGKSASFLNAGILCWPTLHRGISPIHHLSWPCNQSNLTSRRLTFWAKCQATLLDVGQTSI